MKFYKCNHCGNVITKLVDKNVNVVCCNEPMQELIANSTEAAIEKHIPVVKTENNKVTIDVGSVLHPMEESHFIEFIIVVFNNGSCTTYKLQPNSKPSISFDLPPNLAIELVYAYCNLHGLWVNK